MSMSKTVGSSKRYTLHLTLTKTDESGTVEHEINVKSHNLTLAESTEMQLPLTDVLKGWVAADAE